jgi:hypothetical protein
MSGGLELQKGRRFKSFDSMGEGYAINNKRGPARDRRTQRLRP